MMNNLEDINTTDVQDNDYLSFENGKWIVRNYDEKVEKQRLRLKKMKRIVDDKKV